MGAVLAALSNGKQLGRQHTAMWWSVCGGKNPRGQHDTLPASTRSRYVHVASAHTLLANCLCFVGIKGGRTARTEVGRGWRSLREHGVAGGGGGVVAARARASCQRSRRAPRGGRVEFSGRRRCGQYFGRFPAGGAVRAARRSPRRSTAAPIGAARGSQHPRPRACVAAALRGSAGHARVAEARLRHCW